MYVADVDMKVLCTSNLRELKQKYREQFGENFIEFNYIDFTRQGERCAAQVYLDTLRQALTENKPYHIESKRFNIINH